MIRKRATLTIALLLMIVVYYVASQRVNVTVDADGVQSSGVAFIYQPRGSNSSAALLPTVSCRAVRVSGPSTIRLNPLRVWSINSEGRSEMHRQPFPLTGENITISAADYAGRKGSTVAPEMSVDSWSPKPGCKVAMALEGVQTGGQGVPNKAGRGASLRVVVTKATSPPLTINVKAARIYVGAQTFDVELAPGEQAIQVEGRPVAGDWESLKFTIDLADDQPFTCFRGVAMAVKELSFTRPTPGGLIPQAPPIHFLDNQAAKISYTGLNPGGVNPPALKSGQGIYFVPGEPVTIRELTIEPSLGRLVCSVTGVAGAPPPQDADQYLDLSVRRATRVLLDCSLPVVGTAVLGVAGLFALLHGAVRVIVRRITLRKTREAKMQSSRGPAPAP